MFQPVVPFEGVGGWRLLQRTYDNQFEAFSNSNVLKRDTDYFRENIGSVRTAEELVSDRRLLTVALGAFGLQDDINNKYFIQKMLEEGTTNEDALANRFTDTRYRKFSAAFGMGPGEIPKTIFSSFPETIIDDFERQSFEVAVGDQSDSLRIALSAERSFEDIAASQNSVGVKWFEVMGQPPLRALMETVFRLPSGFGRIDIDQQREIFIERSERQFGVSDPSDFTDPEILDELLTRYTAIAQAQSFSAATSGGANALTLLRGF